eukprot:5313659-Pyramimonas_sp.AAC.1
MPLPGVGLGEKGRPLDWALATAPDQPAARARQDATTRRTAGCLIAATCPGLRQRRLGASGVSAGFRTALEWWRLSRLGAGATAPLRLGFPQER